MIIPSQGFCIGFSVETVVSHVLIALTRFHTLLRNHFHCKLLKLREGNFTHMEYVEAISQTIGKYL